MSQGGRNCQVLSFHSVYFVMSQFLCALAFVLFLPL